MSERMHVSSPSTSLTETHGRDRETWSFSPSYSGFQSPRLQLRPNTARGPPPIAMLMDCMASSQATCSPQVISHGSRASTTFLAGPQLAQPSTLPSALGSGLARWNQHREMPPWMMSAHAARMKQHRNHEGDLIVSIGTPNQHPPSPFTPLFRPLGSVQPNVQPPGRPSTSHQPGRHRYFVSDVTRKP